MLTLLSAVVSVAGKVWRIGLMGYGARDDNVDMVLEAMRSGLAAQGYAFPAVPKAAAAVLAEFPEVRKDAAVAAVHEDAGFSIHDMDGESETMDD